MPRGTRIVVVLVAVVAACGGGLATAADEPSPRRIEYRDDRLTVQLTQVSVTEILDEIARQAGAEIRGAIRDERPVSADFAELPLNEGLHRLLGAQNFTLVYGQNGLRVVDLLGGPQAAVRTPGFFAAGSTTSTTVVGSGQGFIQMLAGRPPLPITGRMATTLGATSATYMQLLDAAFHQEDAVVRTDALRTWLSGVEGDAELRQAFVGQVNSFDDSTLAGMVRNAAGSHAEELVLHVATQARATELRVRASTLLQQLRRAPAPGG